MSRPTKAILSFAALRANYALAKRTAPRSKVFAIVKANAYGHGLERVARALASADGFGLVELEGAMALRERGVEAPVLLLEGFFEANELDVIASHGLATVVHCEDQLRLLEGWRSKAPIDVYFKINTGMNRLGFAMDEARSMLERLQRAGVARSITLMTHFATADGTPGIDEATRRFESVTQGIALPRSLANSAAIFTQPKAHADVARLGIGLYGATPFADRSAAQIGVQPAMTFTSRLIAVQNLQPGATVGYGATFRAERPMRIGVVASGYADGYPRHAPSGSPILVDGVRVNTAGRVSMDMITVDLTLVPDAHVGTPVVMWGEGMPIDEVATSAGTVGYELMCALAPRVAVEEVA